MKRFVYNEKYAKLLIMMDGKKSQIDDLARRIGANSGHLRIVLEQWHKEGIINKDKPGRDYEITLTSKGKALAIKFAEIIEIVDYGVQPLQKIEEPEEVKEPEKTEPVESEEDTKQVPKEPNQEE